MKKTIGDVTLKLRKDREWGEWIVGYYVNGRLDEGKSYYTDSRDDALTTMSVMAEHVRVHGV